MRIRKHAQISAVVYAAASSLNPGVINQSPHVCQLNQSPWDALSFPALSEEYPEEDPPDLLPPPPPPPPPVDGEVSSMENGSISELPEAENSGLSMNLEKWEEITDKNGKLKYEGTRIQMLGSSHCRKKRHSNYRMHLKKQYKIARKPGKNNNPDTRRSNLRVRPKKPDAISSSNPYEYYYYSGFGPRWGKNRRGNNSMADVTNKVVVKGDEVGSYIISESLENEEEEDKRTSSPGRVVYEENSSPDRTRICNFEDGFDYVDDDNEEFVRTKRARKPIKARSLKSLMYKIGRD